MPDRPAAQPPSATKRATGQGARPAPRTAATAPEKPAASAAADDLTEIKGIGPTIQDKLRGLGIATFADLAAADPDQLLAQLKGSQPLTVTRVRGWTEAARERART